MADLKEFAKKLKARAKLYRESAKRGCSMSRASEAPDAR